MKKQILQYGGVHKDGYLRINKAVKVVEGKGTKFICSPNPYILKLLEIAIEKLKLNTSIDIDINDVFKKK